MVAVRSGRIVIRASLEILPDPNTACGITLALVYPDGRVVPVGPPASLDPGEGR